MFYHRGAGRKWRLRLLICLAVPFLPSQLGAQTIRPVIAEYPEKGRGRFDLVNETIVPLNVVLEPKSFSVAEDGSPAFRPLDQSIHLKLSQMSFRLPPQQTYYVFYEATADKYPAWFVIYATFAGMPQQSGLNVQVDLPHTVYLLQKRNLEQRDVQVSVAQFEPTSRRVNIVLENSGESLGRVMEVEITGEHARTVQPGFPLMPRTRRNLHVEWKHKQEPRQARVRFKNFKLAIPLEERRN